MRASFCMGAISELDCLGCWCRCRLQAAYWMNMASPKESMR